jgi:UDP-N-acetylglucosamine--N-acetylmuramyl-(pentapeptide) pyrophosphoryl-undecaprenol N-acetylglucosamine transferase
VYPALAVGEALTADRDANELLYIGVRGRMDESIVREAGLPFEAVRAGPMRVSSPLRAVRSVIDLAAGAVQAWRILGRFRPDAVFATGGYASVPVGIASRLRRCALVVYLPDVRPGWAVRLLSRLATRVATTTDASLSELPSGKGVVVGYPVRESFRRVNRDEARQRLSLPVDAKVLLVSGASQGAHRLNVAVMDQLDALLDGTHVMHLTGRADESEVLARRDALPGSARERYHVYGYLDDMASAMAAADLAVMRAGASTLGELPAAGLPAVLVPGVYEGWDQSPNARYLEEQGAGVMLEQSQIETLSATVRGLLADEARLRSMSEAMRKLARPDAARDIARLLGEVAA